MSTLSQLDLGVRLQLAGEGYSNILSKYIDNLKYGKVNKSIETQLFILDIYISILLDYQVCGEEVNCITEDQAQLICDKISQLIDICFQPIGYKYIGSEDYFGIGAMQIGCSFIIS